MQVFELNLTESIGDKKIDDKNLSSISFETYILNETKTTSEKIYFSNQTVKTDMIKKYKYTILYILIVILTLFIFSEISEGKSFLDNVAVVLMLSILVSIFYLLIIPFITIKNIIFDQNFKYFQNIIYKQNILGGKKVLVDLENVGRIVIKKDLLKNYISFRQKGNDKILENVPLLIINSEDNFTIKLTEDLIYRFAENSSHEIDIVRM